MCPIINYQKTIILKKIMKHQATLYVLIRGCKSQYYDSQTPHSSNFSKVDQQCQALILNPGKM